MGNAPMGIAAPSRLPRASLVLLCQIPQKLTPQVYDGAPAKLISNRKRQLYSGCRTMANDMYETGCRALTSQWRIMVSRLCYCLKVLQNVAVLLQIQLCWAIHLYFCHAHVAINDWKWMLLTEDKSKTLIQGNGSLLFKWKQRNNNWAETMYHVIKPYICKLL